MKEMEVKNYKTLMDLFLEDENISETFKRVVKSN